MSTATAVDVDLSRYLRDVIEDAIAHHPRSLQVELGPSDIATACDRCLVHLLAGHKATEHVVPWLPTIGTAVHTWLDQVMRFHAMATDDGDRWHTEERVTVGTLNGTPITGRCDLFDEATGTVVDWKLVGKTTLDKVRRGGASATYRTQTYLYGKGYESQGHTVRRVMVLFLPRNAVSLQHMQAWTDVYDPRVPQLAMERANALAAGIASLGVEAVLAMSPPHTGQEFSCGKWPGETTPDGARQLDGLIPQTPGATATGSTAPTTAHQ